MNIKTLSTYNELRANKWTDGQITTISTYVKRFCENIQLEEHQEAVFDLLIATDMKVNGNPDAKNFQAQKLNGIITGAAEVVSGALAVAKAKTTDQKKLSSLDKALSALAVVGAGAVVIPGGQIIAAAIGIGIGLVKLIGSLKKDYNKDYFYYPTKQRADSFTALAEKTEAVRLHGNEIRMAFGLLPILAGQWDAKKSKNLQADCKMELIHKKDPDTNNPIISYEDKCWRKREGAPDNETLDDYVPKDKTSTILTAVAVAAGLFLIYKIASK